MLFNYDATKDDELTLKVGQIVQQVDTSPQDGWWEGVLDGKKGWFPDNFVEKMPAVHEPPAPVNPPAAAAAPPKAMVKCIFEYEANNEDELSMKVGQMVTLETKEGDEGWWTGTLDGKTGVFPNNFVEELPAGEAGGGAGGEDLYENTASGAKLAEAKKVGKVGFGNIFAQGGVPKLKKTGGTFSGPKPDFLVKKAESKAAAGGAASAPPPPSQPKPAAPAVKPEDVYRVDFDYKAENTDELTMSKGQLIKVLKKQEGGWWEGELFATKAAGWFPDNFVAPASPEEVASVSAAAAPAPAPVRSAPPPKPAAAKPPPVVAAAPATPAQGKTALRPPSQRFQQPPAAAAAAPPGPSMLKKTTPPAKPAAAKPAPPAAAVLPPSKPAASASVRSHPVARPAAQRLTLAMRSRPSRPPPSPPPPRPPLRPRLQTHPASRAPWRPPTPRQRRQQPTRRQLRAMQLRPRRWPSGWRPRSTPSWAS